ncbi:putative pectate lyase 19 [Acorus calamus]|uniref:Pectate lyase n=1 Tax=Acorus calamus TaxID=4465 RepID=A0AAV9EWC0_ACOCL|nr:putative pectate lyase 19 [Acorus calamus]
MVLSSWTTDLGFCDANALKNGIIKNLHDIEVGLKVLRFELGASDSVTGFDRISEVMEQLLSSNYSGTERSLGLLIDDLSSCGESNLPGSVYMTEGMTDFCDSGLVQATQAQTSLQKLIQCINTTTTTTTDPPFLETTYDIESRNKYTQNGCNADGTKCQFLPCARGKNLHLCAVGFAFGVMGGADGLFYTVNRSDDINTRNPPPGSLRHAVNFALTAKGGVWITFRYSMTIRLNDKLWINSHTTIDGRGVHVVIEGYGLAIARAENVIIHNVEVRSTGQSDTVHVFDDSRRVWIDHLTSTDGNLGLVSVVQGSTDVTISNCYLSSTNYNMLLGAADSDIVDRGLRVTVYRNWFDRSTQRMPHCRWGYCHVSNNYYRGWKYYAIGGRAHAKILSEKNVFEPSNRREITPWFANFRFSSEHG